MQLPQKNERLTFQVYSFLAYNKLANNFLYG